MRGESYFKSHKPSSIVYLASIAGFIVCVGAVEIFGYDVWWHLAMGRVIAMLGEIPRGDIFSYTAFGAPWINQQWLFQIVQWLIYDAAGSDGLIAIKFALVATAALMLFRTTSLLTSSRNLALWGVILFLWVLLNRVMDRPFILSLCFLAAYCLLLHRYSLHGGRSIWALPLLQIIWINCHGAAMIGVWIIAAFALGESLQALSSATVGGPRPIAADRIWRLWFIAIASLAACLINPWGAQIFPYYIEVFELTTVLRYTVEWLPFLHPKYDLFLPHYAALVTALATLASFIVNARRARLSHLILTAGAVLLMIRGSRFGPEMMMINVPIMMFNFTQRTAGRATLSNRASWLNVAAAFAISAMALTFGMPISTRGETWNLKGRGISSEGAPAHLVRFLDDNGIRGRVLNSMGLGAYLIFSRWPQELVFIDGRTPLYGDAFFKKFMEMFRNNRNFDEIVEEYGPDYIVLSAMAGWDQRWLHAYLWQHPRWHLVYATNQGYVYLRDVPKFKDVIEEHEFARHPLVEEMRARQRTAKGSSGEQDG